MQAEIKNGHIKVINTKGLVSGDSATRITIEVDNPQSELLDQINKVMVSDVNKSHEVKIIMMA